MAQCPECDFRGMSYDEKPIPGVPQYREGEAYCEDCGSHFANVCPECGEVWDTIFERLTWESVELPLQSTATATATGEPPPESNGNFHQEKNARE